MLIREPKKDLSTHKLILFATYKDIFFVETQYLNINFDFQLYHLRKSTDTNNPHMQVIHDFHLRPTPASHRSHSLLNNSAWRTKHQLPARERARLSYERAKSIGLAYGITKDDLLTLSQKFWDLHRDPITCVDGAATTLLTIQYNLAAGTIAQFSENQDGLELLVDELLNFKKIGQFMLTEVGHGLDVANIETVATRLASGEFILTSPTPSSAKYMPPTIPTGLPTIAVVFARLLVNGEDYGVRPFLVPLNDGQKMCKGVTARLLPYRELASPVNHAITTFKNVRLAPDALLGPLEKSDFPHLSFLQSIWRIGVGSIALGSIAVPVTKIHATIGALYSMRRCVGNEAKRVPLLHFRTQQIPVLTAIAHAYILDAFQKWAAKSFSDPEEDMRVRHGIATCFKAVAVQVSQATALAISERCGAQGLQSFNMMTRLHAEVRGISIAEGDILVVSIRLATELFLGRYELPPPEDSYSLLARHESSLLEKYRNILAGAASHRDAELSKIVLPHCQRIVEAIGHRMAYDAAVSSGIPRDLIDLYVASIVQLDSAWYSENADLSLQKQEAMQAKALDATVPHTEELIRNFGVKEYISAPIISDKTWDNFVDSLETFRGEGGVSQRLQPQRATELSLRAHL